MFDWIAQFISQSYQPHGYCLLWRPELIWTHVISDTLIALSYFSIPIALIHFVRSRRDVEFGGMIWLFAIFILACGTSHVLGVWNLWHGDYGLEAAVKAITALASVPTAILLWRLIPKALAIPSPTQLQMANAALSLRIDERDQALAQLKAEIAQRERAEAALIQAQKIEAVGQLTGGIAHDFNNLLQAISGNLELIERKPDRPDQVQRWAANARKGVVRGTKLAGQLLAFSRVQRLSVEPVDMNDLIHGMQELLRTSVGAQVECDVDLDPSICAVKGDRTQLELVILNLAINARDAMPDGGYLLIATRPMEIAGRDDLPDGAYVELSLTDTGTGMPEEIRARALEPFFTTKGVGSGTGLGLSMAFGVARQSGGTLEIRSAVGRGTTICVLLPCSTDLPNEYGDAAADTHDGPPDPAAGRGLRALVVDDDDDVRAFVVESLESAGFACFACADGPSALAEFADRLPDIVFLDFAMPVMSGAEVAAEMRKTEGYPPIVFMTGYADSAALDEVLGARVSVIRKPFGVGALVAAGLRQIASR
ncbi:response regulator [Sphingomonas sp. MMS24-J45]|uniref:response regulator n=1 Tax=Sphingomonas sp. MMS24-J45 TaxID=3238806 RepID=UPI00384F7475